MGAITALNLAHLFHWSHIILHCNLRPPWRICPNLSHVTEFCRGTNWALTFAAIHKQPLPLLCYSGISRLQDAASVAQQQFLHSCVRVCSGCVGVSGRLIWTLSWVPVQPFSNTLGTLSAITRCNYIFILHTCQLVVNFGGGQNMLTP